MEHFNWWHLINPLITFIAGLVALIVYLWQKQDKKSDGAAIVLMEIRLAEKGIEIIKRSGSINPNVYNPLLISNHWIEYSHLFVKNLDQNEMDAINNFYNDCITIDKSIEQLSISKQLEQKSKAIHDSLSKIALDVIDMPEVMDSRMAGQSNGLSAAARVANMTEIFNEKKDKFTNLIFRDATVVPASLPLVTIQNKIQNINSILNCNIGAKLKKIARYK